MVGTTTDYVDRLEQRHPDRLVFLTDAAERNRASEAPPPAQAEAVADLANVEVAHRVLCQHLARYDIRLTGAACFDCESLVLAADMACALHLPYPSPDAILVCRDKAETKRRWRLAGVPCARGGVARNLDEARTLFGRLGGQGVLKPRSGTGSELVTVARTMAECEAAFTALLARLAGEGRNRLYAVPGHDLRHSVLIEEFLAGPEYSCDFVIDGDRLDILRTARKIPARRDRVGQSLAYIVPSMPSSPDADALAAQLREAAQALGIRRAVCMADFIIVDRRAVMLELTPRPGGDCLPRLVRRALERDILADALDLAEGLEIAPSKPDARRPLVGLVLMTNTPGTIKRIDAEALRVDSRVIDIHLTRRCGDRLSLDRPAASIVGEVIFAPRPEADIEGQCHELQARLALQVEGT